MKIEAQVVANARRNLAVNHLRTAVKAALGAHIAESEKDTSVLGAWFDDLMQSVPVAIILSGASLEADVNEHIDDILSGLTGLTVRVGTRLQLQDLKADRSGNSLGKYRRVAWLFDKEPDEGELPWQDAKLLVQARNGLMHFRPVWDHAAAARQDGDLIEGLKRKVPIARHFQSPLVFPHSFATFGFAKWSIESALRLSHYFSGLLGLTDKLANAAQGTALP
jgi:hypothetical protein